MSRIKLGYRQILSALEEWIRSGKYKPGDQFPTEKELTKQFGVAKVTVIRALNILRENGTLISERGRGTFVSINRHPKARRLEIRGVIRREIEALEGVSKSKVITGYTEPSDRLRILFDLADDENIIESEYFMKIKRKKFAYIVSQFPPRAGKYIIHSEEDMTKPQAISRILHRQGMTPERVETSIAATIADTDLANKLDVNVGAPILRVTKLIHQADDRVFQRQIIYYRSDLYEYDIEHIRTEIDYGEPPVDEDILAHSSELTGG